MSIPLPGRTLPLVPTGFGALRHRNFRLLWIGQFVSLIGRWMQSVAQGWLVLELSGSAFDLGFVGFCSFSPILLFALVGGAAADRVRRRRALLWTQGTAMVLALSLALLTALGIVEVWHIAVIAFGVGVTGAFDIPIRQSLLQDLVGRADLPNAIALNSLAFNGARLIGPALAGVLLAAAGEATVFLLNALSYLAVLFGLVRMRAVPGVMRVPGTWLAEMREGVRWVASSAKARVILSLVVISSVFGLPYSILLPVFARDVLDVGSRGLGFLTGATGLGAVIGALYLARQSGDGGRGRVVAAAIVLLGSGLVAFSQSTHFALSLSLLVVVGGAMIVQMASSNTLLQLLAPAELRGRVVGFYMLAFMGMAPIGSLLAGVLASEIGVRATVRIGGLVCLATGGVLAVRLPSSRRGAASATTSARGSRRRTRSGP
ncbi:MAG TPA: MFS transporter [Candidatus Polarisedimenticolaceae bacterium]|nr:MFS transporter [Candidatus Polarisedimenticolaceae bacterium]